MKKMKKGFTLIELLVVIAVIAMLLSILTPALSKAKEKAKLILCKNNLKQQGLATDLYIQDNDQIFPSAYLPYAASDNDNAIYTYIVVGGKMGTELQADIYKKRLLNPYLGVEGDASLQTMDSACKIFVCPSDKGAVGGAMTQDRTPHYYEKTGRSYKYNSDACNNSAMQGLWNKKLPSVKNPYNLIVAGDQALLTYSCGYDPYLYAYWHNKTENGWANILYADQHVDFKQMTNKNPQTGQREPGYDFQNGEGWTFIYNRNLSNSSK